MAIGFSELGYAVRMLEERRNATLKRTLETVGSNASRHVYSSFPEILIHSFEPRTGALLMEWLARELSVSDYAIVVNGVPVELARWVANLDHKSLGRAYVTYRPEEMTDDRRSELELDLYDGIFATSAPPASIDWRRIERAIASRDLEHIDPAFLPPMKVGDTQADPATVAQEILRKLEDAAAD